MTTPRIHATPAEYAALQCTDMSVRFPWSMADCAIRNELDLLGCLVNLRIDTPRDRARIADLRAEQDRRS